MLLPDTFPLYANVTSVQTGSFIVTVDIRCIIIDLLSAVMCFYWNQTQVLKGLSTDDFNTEKSKAVYHNGILSTVTLILLPRASSAIDLG